MPLSIRIISSPPGENITQWNHAFPEDGGEIGRIYGSTLQLNDAARIVSGTHAIIKKLNRGYQIQDMSSNGLFINGSSIPLGKGNQATLNDGDVLDIGRYRLQVSCFVAAEATAQPLEQVKNPLGDLFNDDPFYSPIQSKLIEKQAELEELRVEKQRAAGVQKMLSMPRETVIENDPFLTKDVSEQVVIDELDLDFQGLDDDPFEQDDYSTYLLQSPDVSPININRQMEAKPTESYDNYSMLQYRVNEDRDHEEMLKKQMKKALDEALTRFLAELEPDVLEYMFDDLIQTKWFARKPNYWKMYKLYFARRVQFRDWHIKFSTYFQEALEELRLREGEE